MTRSFRPTLWTHVQTQKYGRALADFAMNAHMPSLTDEHDEALALMRAHLRAGPQRSGCCSMCGTPSFKNQCEACTRLCKREVELLKRKHGPPPADNRCTLCNKVSSRTLALDHRHGDGQARGYVCNRCNAAIGLFDASPGRFLNFVADLRR